MIDNYKESKLVPCLIAASLLPGTSQSQADPLFDAQNQSLLLNSEAN